jgi:RND family efflux transporter MFP subunit
MEIIPYLENLLEKWPVTRWKGKIWGMGTLGGTLVLLLVLIIVLPMALGETSDARFWATVRRGDFSVHLIESGEVEAVRQQYVTAPMMWSTTLQIIDLIPEGTIVKEGDFLIQFDTGDLSTNLDLARDQLSSQLAELEKLEAQQRLTMSNMEKQLDLSNYSYQQAQLRLEMRKFESEAMKEEARLQLKQAEIALNRTRKQLESQKIIHNSQIISRKMLINQARNRVKELEERFEQFTLRAPCDGMVVYQEVGSWTSRERLKEGYTAHPREDLISIPDLSNMRIKLYINEVDRQKMRKGLKAKITLDAYPETEFTGEVIDVARLAQKVSYESELKGFEVYVSIDGQDPRLKPGISAQVLIELENYKDKLYIPVGTIFEKEGQTVVFPKGRQNPVAVYLGPRNEGYVIVERGLNEGMKLSYTDPTLSLSLWGSAEEKKRVENLSKTIRESFTIFEKQGILFDYIKDQEGLEEPDSEKPGIDLDKLPPSIRDRLKSREGSTTEKPDVQVGSPDNAGKRGSFTVSPEMMKRLEKSTENK